MDPKTQRKIKDVATGNQFYMKLVHTSEGKEKGRGGGGYTADDEPAKGGPGGAARMAMMDLNALISHGATAVLRDKGVRGQRNDDYWLQFMQGYSPKQPAVPMVYRKFVDQLKAAGVNVVRDGPHLNIMALTNKDVDKLAEDRNIENGNTVDFREGLKAIPGGLFDPKMTGSHHGNKWAAIKLDEPLVNPTMEEPARRVLGLTKQKFEDVIAGKADLNGKKGPAAIAEALDKINLDRELILARARIDHGPASSRDDAIRKLGYLKSAQKMGLHPRVWVEQ